MTIEDNQHAYTVEHVRETLATHPRVSELHVDVTIVGNKVFLTGEVGTRERKAAISEVVGELLPDCEVHNETTVLALAPSGDREEL